MSDVAVIIPLYNGGPWIERTLAAVLAQTRPPVEIVVVDDGSQDDSLERLQRFTNVKLVRNPRKGPRHARNHGLELTSASLVAFLDQDDVWHPTHLEHLSGLLDQHPSAVAATAACTTFNHDDELTFAPAEQPEVRPLDVWSNFPFGSVQCPSAILIRREPLVQISGWNPGTLHVADVELLLKLASGGVVLQSESITVGVRAHGDSYSGELRTYKLDQYLRALCDMAAGLVEHRRAVHPGEAEFLTRRLELARRFHTVGECWVANDGGGLLDAVARLADAIEQEPAEFRPAALHTLFWFLCPPRLPWRRRWHLADLYHNWPPALAPIARPIQWATMKHWPCRLFAAHFACRPWQWRRLTTLLQSLREHWAPVAEPAWLQGIDADGWAKQSCTLRFPRQSARHGVCVDIHIPGWTGSQRQDVHVAVDGHAMLSANLPAGDHELMLPWIGAGKNLIVQLRCGNSFAMPHEARMRSLLVTGTRYLRRPGETSPTIRRKAHHASL